MSRSVEYLTITSLYRAIENRLLANEETNLLERHAWLADSYKLFTVRCRRLGTLFPWIGTLVLVLRD